MSRHTIQDIWWCWSWIWNKAQRWNDFGIGNMAIDFTTDFSILSPLSNEIGGRCQEMSQSIQVRGTNPVKCSHNHSHNISLDTSWHLDIHLVHVVRKSLGRCMCHELRYNICPRECHVVLIKDQCNKAAAEKNTKDGGGVRAEIQVEGSSYNRITRTAHRQKAQVQVWMSGLHTWMVDDTWKWRMFLRETRFSSSWRCKAKDEKSWQGKLISKRCVWCVWVVVMSGGRHW